MEFIYNRNSTLKNKECNEGELLLNTISACRKEYVKEDGNRIIAKELLKDFPEYFTIPILAIVEYLDNDDTNDFLEKLKEILKTTTEKDEIFNFCKSYLKENLDNFKNNDMKMMERLLPIRGYKCTSLAVPDGFKEIHKLFFGNLEN